MIFLGGPENPQWKNSKIYLQSIKSLKYPLPVTNGILRISLLKKMKKIYDSTIEFNIMNYHTGKSETFVLLESVFGKENLVQLKKSTDEAFEKEEKIDLAMNEKRLYQVFATRQNCNTPHECRVEVYTGDHILDKAEDALVEKFGRKSYQITKIIEIPKCEGCQIEACGQRDHMDHPDGCLHDSSFCVLCQMDLKELLE
jgi:hypothetical protein